MLLLEQCMGWPNVVALLGFFATIIVVLILGYKYLMAKDS